MSGLYAAMTVEGVQRVAIAAPLGDVVCDLSEAAYCTAVELTHGGYAD
jgi:phage-related baseplate assembly protein